jgi:hypothetical protein
MDGMKDAGMYACPHVWMDGWNEACTGLHVGMDGWMHVCMHVCMCGWNDDGMKMHVCMQCRHVWMGDGWME